MKFANLNLFSVENNETLISICRRLIERSLDWGDPSSWTNEDFEQLSEKIFEKTAVRLSVSTLKRIWGKVRYDNSPTTATLNALARFAGFGGWREFQQSQSQPSPQSSPDLADHSSGPASAPVSNTTDQLGGGAFPAIPVPGTIPAHHPSGEVLSSVPGIASAAHPASGLLSPAPLRRRLFMTALIVSTVILIGLVSLFGSRFHAGQQSSQDDYPVDLIDSTGVAFAAREVTDDLPNSVVFTYNASSLQPDKVMIQQSWDTTRRETVPADGSAHTSLYYYPGYFISKLIVDGVIRREYPVFIRTKGWKGIIGRKPLPLCLTPEETRVTAAAGNPAASGSTGVPGSGPQGGYVQSMMGISSQTLRQKTGSNIFNNTWAEFFNIREFEGVSASHFTFTTTLRNTSTVEQCLCRKIMITLLGTDAVIIIPLADKGCISDINLLTGERWISGKDNDLSGFGCDFRDFQHFTCTVENHHLKITLNGKPVFDTKQQLTIGRIVGIRIAFEGAGEIKERLLARDLGSRSISFRRSWVDIYPNL